MKTEIGGVEISIIRRHAQTASTRADGYRPHYSIGGGVDNGNAAVSCREVI